MENPTHRKRSRQILNRILIAAGIQFSCVPVSERSAVKSKSNQAGDVGGALSINSPGCQAVALSQGGAYLTGSGIDDRAEQFKEGILEQYGSKFGGLEIQATSYESLNQDPDSSSAQLTQSLPAEVSKFQIGRAHV